MRAKSMSLGGEGRAGWLCVYMGVYEDKETIERLRRRKEHPNKRKRTQSGQSLTFSTSPAKSEFSLTQEYINYQDLSDNLLNDIIEYDMDEQGKLVNFYIYSC